VTVVFAGGGTGGHLYPAIAIADALRARGDAPVFVGTAGRLESTLVPAAGYPLHTVASRAFVRAGAPLRKLREAVQTAAVNGWGTLQSLRLLRRLHPAAIVATGGYVCFPVVAAARLLRTVRLLRGPIALLEPNAQPGLTNRLLAPLVDEIWGAFDNADPRLRAKYVRTGTPLRASLQALPSREAALERLGLRADRKTLLAMGGSQGARSINDALTALIRDGGLPEGWQVLHVTGEREYDRVRGALGGVPAAVRPYLHDLADAYAAADLVLARAGASTIGELSALGKPALLVPYPHAAEGHQEANAAPMAAAGAALVIADRDLPGALGPALAAAVEPARLAAMRAAARTLGGGDPLATIVARVDVLTARMKTR
jgi:UDP-N-acetylglucosamine--N-acetylmuramyl-(pentapeptide) pyrophosphoryl-undecaprenol N-acetylglucosamine transferase